MPYSIDQIQGGLAVKGKLTYRDAPRFRQEFHALAANLSGKTRLDLNGVETMDVSAVAVFIEIRDLLQSRGGDLLIVGTSAQALAVLRDSQLAQSFSME